MTNVSKRHIIKFIKNMIYIIRLRNTGEINCNNFGKVFQKKNRRDEKWQKRQQREENVRLRARHRN